MQVKAERRRRGHKNRKAEQQQQAEQQSRAEQETAMQCPSEEEEDPAASNGGTPVLIWHDGLRGDSGAGGIYLST